MSESISLRLRRSRREEGTAWTEEDEAAWVAEFPDAQPEPWMAGKKEYSHIVFDDDLIPDTEYVGGRAPDPGEEAVDGLDIIDAYAKWCGKMVPKVGSKRESIMISCPDPAHRDSVPSAWINLDKQTWYCGRDEMGGDKFTIASFHFGLSEKTEFPELKRKMAEDLGFATVKSLTGKTLPVQEEAEPEPEQTPAPLLSVVPDIADDDLEKQLEDEAFQIDWKAIAHPDSFLFEWMSACTVNDIPEEYFFWLGMQALSAAAGPEVYLQDSIDIKSNLYVCLYGGSGTKKSQAIQPYVKLLRGALPFDDDPYSVSDGTKLISQPASSEALLEMLQQKVSDPGDNSVSIHPLRTVLKMDELATFMQRALRSGSTLKSTLIELFDIHNDEMRYFAATRGTDIVVKSPYFQMVSTTQPKAIHEFLTRSDAYSGFLNRWLFAAGTRRVARISHGGKPVDIDYATELLKTVKTWGDPGIQMEFQSDGLRKWDEFFQAVISPLYDRDEDPMLIRIDLMLKKIMVILACNELETEITEDIVSKAIQLFPYLQKCYTMLSSAISHNEFEECEQHIMEILRKNPALSTGKLVNRLKHKFGNKMIENCLKTLEALELVDVAASKAKNGRAVRTYSVAK